MKNSFPTKKILPQLVYYEYAFYNTFFSHFLIILYEANVLKIYNAFKNITWVKFTNFRHFKNMTRFILEIVWKYTIYYYNDISNVYN